ncbi:MAG: hypothetical protein EOP47_19390 [Sphingobacteriaceae bacterium]|nr:MAG: hypothetical protein EOP47_19390 [Sphingobacteriaceae bacterium]
MESRQQQIKTLRRNELRAKTIPDLLIDISNITNHKFEESDILDFDEIDQHVIELNSTDFSFNYLNLSFPQKDSARLGSFLDVLNNYCSKDILLSFHASRDIVLLKTNLDIVSTYFQELVAMDGHTIFVYDAERKNGFWIDLFEDYWYLNDSTQFLWIYEFRVFGKDWMEIICDKGITK